jgi:NaMN:DMB phosphoribosyltransferase
MYQVSVAVFTQTADLYCARVGAAATAPADKTVVVPDVTALIVQVPTPMLRTVMAVPIGKATLALVGILKAIAVALFIISRA